MSLIVFHVDLDCFFASVAVLDHPEFTGVPLIIGANPKKGKGRGVVSTCSYEAREYGIHSGMPISQAYERCPFGIYTRPKFSRIKEISTQVMKILQTYCELFQQAGIDEAYLDMTEEVADFKEAEKKAHEIKNRVQKETGVTCSIGVSYSKTLAKIGSDFNKPNGVTIITHKNYQQLLSPLPITRIPGIGKKTKEQYFRKGVHTFNDIYALDLPELIRRLGDNGQWIYKSAHGTDGRHVHDSRMEYDPKSISKECTFHEDTADFQLIYKKLEEMNAKIHAKLIKRQILYRTITIKIRFHGFITYTRSQSLGSPNNNQKLAKDVIYELMGEFERSSNKIRLIGLKFSNFSKSEKKNQLKLTDFVSSQERK
ncbi:MAG: DNA polymerase IV [Promethearchaeota archaeon]